MTALAITLGATCIFLLVVLWGFYDFHMEKMKLFTNSKESVGRLLNISQNAIDISIDILEMKMKVWIVEFEDNDIDEPAERIGVYSDQKLALDLTVEDFENNYRQEAQVVTIIDNSELTILQVVDGYIEAREMRVFDEDTQEWVDKEVEVAVNIDHTYYIKKTPITQNRTSKEPDSVVIFDNRD